jgi:hypothetical protein
MADVTVDLPVISQLVTPAAPAVNPPTVDIQPLPISRKTTIRRGPRVR